MHAHTHKPSSLKCKCFPLRFNKVSQGLLLGHIRAGRSSLWAGEKFCFPSCTHRGMLCRHGIGNLFDLAQRPVSTFRKWSQKEAGFQTEPAAHKCPGSDMPYLGRVPISPGCPGCYQRSLWGWLWARKGRSNLRNPEESCDFHSKAARRATQRSSQPAPCLGQQNE